MNDLLEYALMVLVMTLCFTHGMWCTKRDSYPVAVLVSAFCFAAGFIMLTLLVLYTLLKEYQHLGLL